MTHRALLTGASGFVGSHLLQALLEFTDWDVVCVSSFCHNGTTDRIQGVVDAHPLGCDRVQTLTHDLVAPLSTRQLTQVGDVDYVFNVASRCSVDESIAAPRDFIVNNVALVLTVLDIARELTPRRVFHLSTDEVYGSSDGGERGHRPSSPYAASKAAQEDICQAYARTYDVPLTIVTSANMFGERQSQLAFIPRVVRATLRGERVPIHVGPAGPGRRSYTYAGDLAARIITSHEFNSRVLLPGLFDVDNLTLARTVARFTDRELLFDLVPGASRRPGWDHAYRELPGDADWFEDLEPERHESLFEDRLYRTVRWFVEHPEWLE